MLNTFWKYSLFSKLYKKCTLDSFGFLLKAKKISLCLSIFFSCFLFSQFSDANSFEKQSQLINQIENAYPKTNTINALEKLIVQKAKERDVKNQSVLQIIKNVFVARKTADLQQKYDAATSQLYLQAVKKSEKLKREDFGIWSSIYYAYYLYNYRHYKQALPYYIICDQKLNDIPETQLLQPGTMLKLMGYFFSTAQEYEKSNNLLQKARKHFVNNPTETAGLLDNIGTNYVKLNQLKNAQSYYNQALELSLESHNKIRYAKVLGNYAKVKSLQGDKKTAEQFLLKDIAISTKTEDDQNTMFAHIQLAKLYLATKQIDNAEITLKQGEKIALSKSHFKSSELEIVQLLQKVAAARGDEKNELYFRKKEDSLAQYLKKLDGKDAISQINWETQKENFRYQLKAEKAQHEKESFRTIAAFLLVLLLIIIFFFVLKSLRNRWKIEKTEYDKKVLSLSLDKLNSEHKLNTSEQTIASYKVYLHEKNQQIDDLEREISKIGSSSASYLEQNTKKLQQLLDSHLMTQENWDKFKKIYIEENAEEYKNIMSNFPDLTDSNQRIVILSRLGVSNHEMTRILGVTIEAIKKAKQRLRKKYETSHQQLFDNDY